MKLLILFCQLNNKLTIDLKQEIVKATLVKTLLDKIPSYLFKNHPSYNSASLWRIKEI